MKLQACLGYMQDMANVKSTDYDPNSKPPLQVWQETVTAIVSDGRAKVNNGKQTERDH